MTRIFYLLILSLSSICVMAQVDTISLNENWSFREGTDTIWKAAVVPGTVQEDLIRLGDLPHPFVQTNEDSIQWVEEKNWIYKQSFSLSDAVLGKANNKLVFKGLDTYAEVWLNGKVILRTNNMFREYTLDVNKYLQKENTLKIIFLSPLKIGEKIINDLPYTLPADNDAGDIKVSPVVRKAAFHFGWDWGPRIVTSGIWRPIYLLSFEETRIEDLFIEQLSIDDESAQLRAHVELSNESQVSYKFYVNDKLSVAGDLESKTFRMPLEIRNPILWWPNGWNNNGRKSHLYNIRLDIIKNGNLLDSYTKKIGIRSIELINEPDSIGTSFYFKINGKPIFAKGANYIPQRHFTNSLSKKDYRELLTVAANSNMNMIRVWGGGIYEEDYFYDLCDSLGLMVWQDFMFANTIYPVDEKFAENMFAEVTDNIIRLRNHPSIVHWCGNNEINVAWHNWGWQKTYKLKKKHQKMLYSNYEYLFKNKIPSIVDSLLPGAPYSHTSPISNWGTDENYNHSTMHYWGVFHGEDPFELYHKYVGRFNSEYGFQSFPNINIIHKYFNPQSFDLEDPLLAHRQKSYKGNRLIYQHMEQYYPMPDNLNDLSYLSQIVQAKGISMALQGHRLKRPHSMGTLYWQLNDCWPAVSWSSIDFNGQWRALHYAVKESYEDPNIYFDTLDNKLDLVLVNDQLDSIDFDIDCRFSDINNKSIASFQFSYTMSGSSQKRFSLLKELKERQDSVGFLDVELLFNDKRKEKTLIVNENQLLRRQPIIDVIVEQDNIGYKVILNSNEFAHSVYLQTDCKGHFSENFFNIKRHKQKVVYFETDEKTADFKTRLKVTSLNELSHN